MMECSSEGLHMLNTLLFKQPNMQPISEKGNRIYGAILQRSLGNAQNPLASSIAQAMKKPWHTTVNGQNLGKGGFICIYLNKH